MKRYTAESPILNDDWQKVNKHDKTDGLSQKAVNAYRRENPGSKLKTAVTTKPSKLKKGSKASKRRASFCARMSGMKKHRAGAKTKRDPNSPINKALRRWNCESIEEMQDLILYAEQVVRSEKQMIAEKWSQKYKNSINCSHPKGFSQRAHCQGKKKHNESITMEMTCPDCGMCEGHAGYLMEIKKGQKDSNGFTKCWPGHHAAGTKKGKNGGRVRNCVPNESVAEVIDLMHPSSPISPLNPMNVMKASGLLGSEQQIVQAGMNVGLAIGSAAAAVGLSAKPLTHKVKEIFRAPENATIREIKQVQSHIKELYKKTQTLKSEQGRDKAAHELKQAYEILNQLKAKIDSGVAEGGNAQQAAIAIAKQKSGKYNKEGKRIKEEVSDPNKLIATVNINGENKQFDLTGMFQGNAKAQMSQAGDFITNRLEDSGVNFSNIEIKFNGIIMRQQNLGSMSPHSDWEKEAEARAAQMRAQRPPRTNLKENMQIIGQWLQQVSEEGKAKRALCLSSKPDEELGASQLSSCKSQGLRARDGNKSHKLGKSPKSRVKVDGKKIKGNKYGGPLPDWS